jgi:hypothetical protein
VLLRRVCAHHPAAAAAEGACRACVLCRAWRVVCSVRSRVRATAGAARSGVARAPAPPKPEAVALETACGAHLRQPTARFRVLRARARAAAGAVPAVCVLAWRWRAARRPRGHATTRERHGVEPWATVRCGARHRLNSVHGASLARKRGVPSQPLAFDWLAALRSAPVAALAGRAAASCLGHGSYHPDRAIRINTTGSRCSCFLIMLSASAARRSP